MPLPCKRHRKGSLPLLIVAALFGPVITCASAQPVDFAPALVIAPNLIRINNLMHNRLSLMRDVAAWKWVNKEPIEDLERERELLARLNLRAVALGFEAESVERIFLIQFDMAKSIQRYWHDRWELAGFPDDWQPVDLQTVLRPQLTDLAEQILIAIYLQVPALRSPVQGRLPDMHPLTELPMDPGLVLQLERAFKGLSLLPLHQVGLVKRVRSSGYLRVGTTGDYPPFTVRDGSWWDGADLQLAHLLARSLGSKVALVPTTWPTLLHDLREGHFDIAMGGVSVTRERRRYGYFSDPYHRGGKQLIGRCEDRDLLNSLERVDRPGIRVIVNPGGTNEDYVRANIELADIVVYEDNTTIFDELEEGRADVMITDAVEVHWQSRRRQALCPLSKRLLTKTRKAYLTQRDKEFVGEVDVWLERMRRSGQLKQVLQRYLHPE